MSSNTVTATPEYIARSMLTIARQPATPDDDDKWCASFVEYITQNMQALTPEQLAAPALVEVCEAAEKELVDIYTKLLPELAQLGVGSGRPEDVDSNRVVMSIRAALKLAREGA